MDTFTSSGHASPARTLLIIDTDTQALDRLIALFEPDGYAINTATTTAQALAMAALVMPDLVLFGASLPEQECADICRQIRIDPLLRDIPIVCITAKDDALARLRVLEVGADDIFPQPLNDQETRARVHNIVQQDRPRKIAAQRLEYARVQSEMETALDAILEKWAFSQEKAGVEPLGHTRRVTDLTVAVAREMKINEDEIIVIRRGAILHDIGKIANEPDDVLEWDQMPPRAQASARLHPLRAQEMLWSIPLLRPALAIPLYHHERWDGSGYPNGLQGGAIPLPARIFAVVDVWDELCAGHPHRAPWQPEQVKAYLRAQADKWFDPTVVAAFLKVLTLHPTTPVPSTPPASAQKRSPATKPDRQSRKLWDSFSLSRRGAWAQLTVAALLITVLPLLGLVWLWQENLNSGGLPATITAGVYVVILTIMLSGYVLLGKYPLNIVRLRHYLRTLANGEMPVSIQLSKDTDDLTAMQQYMTEIVRQAAERIRVIKAQQDRLLHAERQRVMIESLAALCHHLGQPATLVAGSLHQLQQQANTPETEKIIKECQQSFDAMQDILNRLQRVVVYRTEPYLGNDNTDAPPPKDRMVTL